MEHSQEFRFDQSQEMISHLSETQAEGNRFWLCRESMALEPIRFACYDAAS
jgi:hypothetical protein